MKYLFHFESPTLADTVNWYGSASDGNDPVYHDQIKGASKLVSLHGGDIVTGGGTTGGMGAAKDGAEETGAHITIVIPDFIVEKERRPRQTLCGLRRAGLELWQRVNRGIIIKGQDEEAQLQLRQRLMLRMARRGTVATFGGSVTMAEVFEVIGQKKYGLRTEPFVLFSPGGQWDPLLHMMEAIKGAGFDTSFSARMHEMKSVNPKPAPYVVVKNAEELLLTLGFTPGATIEREAPAEREWFEVKVDGTSHKFKPIKSPCSKPGACTPT